MASALRAEAAENVASAALPISRPARRTDDEVDALSDEVRKVEEPV